MANTAFDKLKRYFGDKNYRFKVNARRFGDLKWMPDEPYLERIYAAKLGVVPDLKHPRSFNEKLQWLKLHDRKPLYTTLVDKYAVKAFVAEKIGQRYVIPTLGVWDRVEDIDFDALPDQFVLKCTHDSGGLVICRDKERLDIPEAKRKIAASLKNSYYWHRREWPYKDVPPRILAEKYMEDSAMPQEGLKGLTDYKFFCFNGVPRMMYVSKGLENHATARIAFYDLNGKLLPFHRKDYRPFQEDMTLPENFEEMKDIARRLAALVDCAFVRVDLYSIEGETYFSEITFSPCGGMIPFEPEEWDLKLGEWLSLPASTETGKEETR